MPTGTEQDVPLTNQTLAIIGCGTMAQAILTGVLAACSTSQAQGNHPTISRFLCTVNSNRSAEALRSRFGSKIEVLIGDEGNLKAVQEADVVLLAVKPYMVDKVLRRDLHGVLKGKLIISVCVGTPIGKIVDAITLGKGENGEDNGRLFIKRAMMNIAAQYGASMTVIEESSEQLGLPTSFSKLTDWIFLQCGAIQSVAPAQYDIAGVLAGASGALLSVAFDGMLDGAVSQGLKRADANKILTKALFSLATLLENGEHPAVLREKFSSPKGTTIDGLLSLEEDRARWAFSRAVIASSKRSQEIGEQK